MQQEFQLIGLGGAGCVIADEIHAALGGRLVHMNAADDIASDVGELIGVEA